MFTRLTLAGVVFAITVALYQAYVLVLVPFVEPAVAAAYAVRAITLPELARAPAALQRYRPLLAAYFPPDHWCFKQLPKIIENAQAMIVLDEYHQSDSGELRVPRVALIFFPSGRDRGGEPPRDAIILEPAGGATLQMDQQLDQGHGLGARGRMQYGQLLGAITVRSDMREPGPQDDLSIETKDLYMNEDLIRTTEAVTMRLGGHRGRGRGLEIRFFKTEATSSAAPATLFGKLESLEISHEVAALITPGKLTLFGEPAADGKAPTASDASAREKLTEAPAEIKCSGPFRIDFDNHIATFTEAVRVWQRHASGDLDELTAHELTLYFAETREWGGDVTPTPDVDASALGSIRLEPATVEASGSPDAPVVLNAPSQGAVARGERLVIELIPRQVTLEGSDEVSLNYRGAEIHAPMVQYSLPPKGSNQRLGQMAARGGAGWLRAAPDPKRPGEVLEVRWTQSMQLVRSGGQPLLRLDGRPRVQMLGLGTLWADQLELYLRENGSSNSGRRAEHAAGDAPASIEAERVVATGSVGIESAELNGKVNKLDLKILQPAAQPSRVGGGPAGSGSAAGGSTPQGPGPPTLFDRNRAGTGRRAYHISGSTLEIDALVREGRPQVTAIRVDGGVVFQESTPGASGEAPLRIVAEHLNVTDADTPEAKIEIRGGDAAGTLPAGLAEISARGTILRAPMLAVNRGTSQAWINSPGEVQMLMTRDATGRPLARPQPLAITWRDSMRLDRDRITFLGDVHVQHADGWLRTRKLAALLTATVQFDGAAGRAAPELAQLECWDGAVAEFDQRDPMGAVTAHQHIEVVSLVVNQLTGEIRGDGPGHVDSVHLSKGDGAWMVLPDSIGSSSEPKAVQQELLSGPPKLRHLSIAFVRGVGGNIHTPEVSVYGDVRTIYGAIDSWEQRLEMTAGGSPGPDVFWITCDLLKVTDSPLARLQTSSPDGRRAFGQVELTAETNVVIEGEQPERGAFTLRGHRATYDQAKTMFVLQGDGRLPATITYQQFPGAPFEEQSAQKMFYWQNTGDVRVEGVNKLQLSGFGK